MNGPMSGDIFPAREAIDLIDQIDLGLPLEIPPLPPEAEPKNVPTRRASLAFRRNRPSQERKKRLHSGAQLCAVGHPGRLRRGRRFALFSAEGRRVGRGNLARSFRPVHESNSRDYEKAAPARARARSRRALFPRRSRRRRQDPPLEAGASRRYRDQLREHVFRREGGERLLLRLGQCRSGHSPRVGILGAEPADSFSAGCLFRILRGEIIRAAKTTAGPAMADDGRVPRARSHSSLSCRAATARPIPMRQWWSIPSAAARALACARWRKRKRLWR